MSVVVCWLLVIVVVRCALFGVCCLLSFVARGVSLVVGVCCVLLLLFLLVLGARCFLFVGRCVLLVAC